MAIFKCKMCGGELDITDGASVVQCEYCGTNQTIPSTNDEGLSTLHNRANTLRLKCEFDKAEEIYNKILEKDPDDAEAHWGVILCKYGIEYVEDPKTYKRIPTCHRTSFDAILADDDYKAAIANSDVVQQRLYEAEAKEIDRIQKDILSVVQNEKPFDVFICYKQTDFDGKRTQDSVIANDIYYQLTSEGLKVFYAAITLEDKLGQEYEPYIFAALNSAKVMLVVGSKPEYFTAVWVKNEWSRFLKLMKTDRKKLLIPCYKDMDAYDMPDEFAHLQAQDMGKIGFINDLIRGIKKVTSKEEGKATVRETVVVSSASAGVSAGVKPLIERTEVFLEDGNWEQAESYADRVLDQEPKNAYAYLLKLLATQHVSRKEELKNCAQPFVDNSDYLHFKRYASPELIDEIESYNKFIEERNENARLTGLYNGAISAMQSANSEQAFKAAADSFRAISSFKDAETLAEECLEKAENARKDALYASAKVKMMRAFEIAEYEAAIKTFESISGWRDADEQIYSCQKEIEKLKAKAEADRLEKERLAQIRAVEAEKARKRNKKIAMIASPIVVCLIAFFIILDSVIIPTNNYNKAMSLKDAGKYSEAITAFEALEGYKDSKQQVTACQTAIKDEKYNAALNLYNAGKYSEAITAFEALEGYKDSATYASDALFQKQKSGLASVSVGSTIKFGTYEQDNNTSNGKEEIEWQVLAKEGTKILVISKYALDCKQYNTSYTSVTWETCSLRTWLNGTFYNNAFGAKQQEMIKKTTVSSDKNPSYSTNPGYETSDNVFLLSIMEVEKYFSSDEARKCVPTAYAIAQGAYTSSSYTVGGKATCWWWLRSPGYDLDHTAFVSTDGSVSYFGYYDRYVDDAVRPALWIDLSL